MHQEGRISLRGENDSARLTDHSSGVMVSESRFHTGYDFLTLAGKQDDEIILVPFLGGFVEPAQGVEIIREFQNGIDVKPLGLEFLWHGDADNRVLSKPQLTNSKL